MDRTLLKAAMSEPKTAPIFSGVWTGAAAINRSKFFAAARDLYDL